MPFDVSPPRVAAPDELHGVPRNLLIRKAVEAVPPGLRPLVAGVVLTEAAPMVCTGVNVGRVAWRVVWAREGMAGMSGTIAVWRGEVV